MQHRSSSRVTNRLRVGILAWGVAGTVATGYAQQELTFFVSASTITGERVTDLKPEDVKITEDGKDATVSRVESVKWPIRLTVLVDNGPGTASLLTQYRNGLKALFGALPSELETSLITLAPQPRFVVRASTDKVQIQNGVDRVVPDNSAPRMIEGLTEAANRIEQDNRKELKYFPVVVVVSTTGAEGSTARDREVQKMAEQMVKYAARVHIIMLGTGGTSSQQILGARQVHVGKSIVDLTGGRYEAIAAPTAVGTLLAEFGKTIAEAHAFQSDQYRVTVQRPTAGAMGQTMIGSTRVGVRLTATAQGLKP